MIPISQMPGVSCSLHIQIKMSKTIEGNEKKKATPAFRVWNQHGDVTVVHFSICAGTRWANSPLPHVASVD